MAVASMTRSTERWCDAQQGVLGSALIEPSLVPRVITETNEKDYNPLNRRLYQTMRSLLADGKAVDVVTISERLDAEYRKYLVQLMDVTPTAAHFDTYVEMVRSASKLCAMQEYGMALAGAESAQEAESIVSKAAGMLVGDRSGKIWTNEALMLSFMNRHGQPTPRCLSWPIREMDEALFVTHGKFVILSGEPSTGKSALALQCATHWAKDLRVGYFSLETSGDDLFDRRMAGTLSVPLKRIMQNKLSTDEWTKAGECAGTIAANKNLLIFDFAILSVDELKVLAISHKLDVVIVDYLQFLSAAGSNDYERVTNISLDLHRFAQSSGCNVIALSQHARQPQKQGKSKEPELSSLRGSGQIEQDADVVLMLYYRDPNERIQRVLKCAKNKNGEIFKLILDFDGERQIFSSARKGYRETMADMRRMQREQKRLEKLEGQLTMLPDDTPVPFDEKRKEG